MINKVSDHMTIERLVDPLTLFGDDGERQACRYQCVTIAETEWKSLRWDRRQERFHRLERQAGKLIGLT
jgi:hypothetical protein